MHLVVIRIVGFIQDLLFRTFPDLLPGSVAPRKWNRDQRRWLLQQALQSLRDLIPGCPNDFDEAQGVDTILAFIKSCQDHDILTAALVLVQNAISSSSQLRSAFGLGEGMATILMCLENRDFPEEVRLSAALVTSELCSGEI